MADAVVTLKIMPESPDTDLEALKNAALSEIKAFCNETQTKCEEQPVAFGLKAVQIIFVMDESIGSTESLETKISEISGVNSVEVTDVRRAIG
ncbi:elongation factor 1-beta [Candidatus Woesearchaeota archaeon]|nr:elongation factor 1-beta [Candidatus Woesearchaeota archaeon]|tara:strand:- start:487 stop:765 length:279 start_codon:yes stop_codon:yes gene_type:complete